MSQVAQIVGPMPARWELGPVFTQEGREIREVLGDWDHLHECDRPPKYIFDQPLKGNLSGPFDMSESRTPLRQTRLGKPIAALKGIHSGKCALFFNGPSLNNHDLWKIRDAGIPIIGMNRTHTGFASYKGPQPDYLCVVDWLWLDKPDVVRHPGLINGSTDPREYGTRVSRHFRAMPFSFDLDRDGYVSPVPATTGHLALQVAVYMGFTELYCLGFDLGGKHWDGSPGSLYYAAVNRYHRRQAPLLKERGINVYLCGSPESKNTAFEHRTFEELFAA